MRESVLVITVAIIALTSLRIPKVGLFGYVWFVLARPDVFAHSSRLPYSLVLLIAAYMGAIPHVIHFPNILRSSITRTLLILQLPLFVSVMMARQFALSWAPYTTYVKVVIPALLIPILVTKVRELRYLLLVIAASLGFIAAKFGLYGILKGGAYFKYGYGGMIGDNNGLALAMVMLLPIAWYATETVAIPSVRMALYVISGSAMATVIMTRSRGNSIAMVVVLLLIVWRSRRRLAMLTGVVSLALPALLLTWNAFSDRLATLQDVSSEASAASRLDFASAAVRMWMDYPWFGVGFGKVNYVLLSSQYLGYANDLVVHNTYLQTLVDSGIFTFILYVGLLLGTVLWLGVSVRKTRKVRPDLVAYPCAIQSAILAYAIGSTFYSRNDFEFFYILLAIAGAWQLMSRNFAVSAPEGRKPQPPGVPIAGSVAPAVLSRPGAALARPRLAASLPVFRPVQRY